MDKNWKETKRKIEVKTQELAKWIEAQAAVLKSKQEEIVDLHKLMFEQMKNDGASRWEQIKAFFKYIGQQISWKKWRAVYIGVGLILIGLFLHYILGL